MPSRREPEVSEPVVVAQQVLVLGFDECQGSMNCEQPYSLPNKCNKSNFSQATTASSTRTPARMAVPTGIMRWCLRLSATRGPLLHVNIADPQEHCTQAGYVYPIHRNTCSWRSRAALRRGRLSPESRPWSTSRDIHRLSWQRSVPPLLRLSASQLACSLLQSLHSFQQGRMMSHEGEVRRPQHLLPHFILIVHLASLNTICNRLASTAHKCEHVTKAWPSWSASCRTRSWRPRMAPRTLYELTLAAWARYSRPVDR